MKKTSKSFIASFTKGLKAHKALAAFIVIVCAVGGYEIVHAAKNANVAPQYAVSPAVMGSITQSVSGSGQVSALNQLDVPSQASGAITSILVKVGDHVTKGQLLATIDNTNALNSLENAKLSYAQVTEPPKTGDLNNAQNSVMKAYSDAESSIRSTFLDLQTIMPGLDAMLYSQSGFLGIANSTYLSTSAQAYRTTAGKDYDLAKAEYNSLLSDYSKLSTQSPTSTVEALIGSSYDLLRDVATTLKDMQAAVNYISTNESQYRSGEVANARNSVSSWLSMSNSDVSSLGSAVSSIASSKNSLNNLVTGADPLSVQSSQLSLRQAEQTYSNYFVRAPFDGVVGKIPVSVYGQAGSGTAIATLIGDQKIANITLDEVDAAKVTAGQPVAITFDAINNFTATGTVSQADLVGTVSQGVVSYGIRVVIDTSDARIRPGMSVNVKIITNQKENVLIVPSAAVKTTGGKSYVQVLDMTRTASASTTGTGTGRNFRSFGSTTPMGTTTAFTSGTAANRQTSLTISSATAPHNVTVVTGLSDDQNTEIVSGLDPRQLVVTRTISGSTAATTAAPSILNSLGGGSRTGASTGATRATNVRIGG